MGDFNWWVHKGFYYVSGTYNGNTSDLNWTRLSDDSAVVHGASGSTTDLPTGQAVGYQYFDTTLNKLIWYMGSAWVDATGTTV